MNPDALGKEYDQVAFKVSADRVGAFRGVFGETRDVVPPTFLTALEFAVFPEPLRDPDLALDFSRVVHGEQEYEWRRQPRIGETLAARARIASAKRRGELGFVTIETVLRDAEGEIVAICRSTMIERER